uniref:Eukaryotic translation initiation factor 2-alpha kinase 2 n=1 Tax=Neogobius melanostomus TaxID=47308 RepID=A0A8C6WKD9_9GOBI
MLHVYSEKTSELRVSQVDIGFTKKVDYLSIINKYCQTKNLPRTYIEVGIEGPSHNLQFRYRLEINKQLYPVGKAKNKKDAKQMAAQSAYIELRKQPDWDTVSEDEASEIASTSAIPSSFLITYSCVVCFDRFNSDFDCIEPLGKGSYGCVYKARHKVLDQYRAIKEIRSKDLPREVLVLANLDHPNIVRYFSCWLQDTGYKYMTKTLYHKIELIKGVDLLLLLFSSEVKINTKFLFIEMELCEGGTLRRWIHKKNIAPAENSRQRQSLEFARQILSGVEYIHSKKLIHRDLKPENILFGQDGNVRIGDFGLATQDNDDGELVERTEDSGTRSYMAPEQVGVNYDRKVDVFALGLIFFELFWRIGTGHERIKVCKTTCTIGERVNDVHIIKTMLSTKPEARPEASALKTELKRWTGTPEGNTDQGNLTV